MHRHTYILSIRTHTYIYMRTYKKVLNYGVWWDARSGSQNLGLILH